MLEDAKTRPDVLLLLSLVVVVLLYPVLDHGDFRHLILGVILFVPVILATVKLSEITAWVWPASFIMAAAFVFSALDTIHPSRHFAAMKWACLAAFFALTVLGLFAYLTKARKITNSHLYTAVSIYLLLGFLWFGIYSAIDNLYPGSIQHNDSTFTDRSSELLYFSLVTLSTIGYGDVVPASGEVRMLAALEGMTGVLYVAITVAILVSSYRSHER
jgi:Ion channel